MWLFRWFGPWDHAGVLGAAETMVWCKQICSAACQFGYISFDDNVDVMIIITAKRKIVTARFDLYMFSYA